MKKMPEYVMRDLCGKVTEEITDVVLRTSALVAHPEDKFQIVAHAAYTMALMMIGAVGITVPTMQGECARIFCMKNLNELLQKDDNFLTETIKQTREGAIS